jgi:very-short-patch-repair endonuclease
VNYINNFLINNNITFESQKTFQDCKHKGKLKFDFYIPSLNTCIEYDGQQHFFIIKQWGGELELLDRQRNDKIKNEYCKNNNIRLLRISYKENIEEKLNELFNSLN